jgi:hypothetical protein
VEKDIIKNMSVSSVPLQTPSVSNADMAALAQGKKHHDSILMYCSYFTYGKDPQQQRRLFCEMIQVKNIINKLDQLKCKIDLIPNFISEQQMIQAETPQALAEFLNANDEQ